MDNMVEIKFDGKVYKPEEYLIIFLDDKMVRKLEHLKSTMGVLELVIAMGESLGRIVGRLK